MIRARWQNDQHVRCQLYTRSGSSEQHLGILILSLNRFKALEADLSAGASTHGRRLIRLGKYYTEAKPDFNGGKRRVTRERAKEAARVLAKLDDALEKFPPQQPAPHREPEPQPRAPSVSRRTSRFDPVAMALEIERQEREYAA